MQHDLPMVNKNRHLMMLSQGSSEVYSADNVMFKVNISKARIICKVSQIHLKKCDDGVLSSEAVDVQSKIFKIERDSEQPFC